MLPILDLLLILHLLSDLNKGKMKKIFIIALLFVMMLTACKKIISNDFRNLVVLEGYLFQDEKVDSIHLTKCLSFESEDTVYTPVDDAQISLNWQNNQYVLQNIGNGYYNHSGSDLLIKEGDTYGIDINYSGQKITSSTIVPKKTTIHSLTEDVIYIDTVRTFGPPQNSGSIDAGIEVIWDNPDKSYYYVVIESADSSSSSIVMGGSGLNNGTLPRFSSNFSFRSEPFIGDRYIINSGILKKYGKHLVKIYSVNQEYANLYENRSQDSRNLSEPVTNVINGLGIFTAFSYDEVSFYVKNKITGK
jgi:Domain of unknown function (DUF4249)